MIMSKRKNNKNLFIYEPIDYNQFQNISWDTYEFISGIKYNLYGFEIDDEKQFISYVDQVETIVRKSQEYRIWTNIHPDLQCQVTGYTKEEYRKEIELHHYPYTLFEITSKIQLEIKNRYSLELNYIPTFIVQNEVITLHLLDIVPFVPLLKSYHRMYHQTPWEIPNEKIINNDLIPIWELFFNSEISFQKLILECLKIKQSRYY